ncbi:unnamed protein product [Rangifer tarandus platyrhynchus]|uniref:Uncharacterized protein n=2 Tax=Rangifer tarandus platyrhynchus TaxID=3082113 RepID=A0AC59YHR5_RANTA|nr:unnamed protein product [Rangifer tarandus platyrhynchus]
MVKKMLEVVVNYLYPALTTVKTDWLFLCTPDSVMFATSHLLFPSPNLFRLQVPFTSFEMWSRKLLQCPTPTPVLAPEASPPGQPWTLQEAASDLVPASASLAVLCLLVWIR